MPDIEVDWIVKAVAALVALAAVLLPLIPNKAAAVPVSEPSKPPADPFAPVWTSTTDVIVPSVPVADVPAPQIARDVVSERDKLFLQISHQLDTTDDAYSVLLMDAIDRNSPRSVELINELTALRNTDALIKGNPCVTP